MAIPLGDGTFGYCRALKFPKIAVYQLKSDKLLKAEQMCGSEIAFKVSVMQYAFTGRRWKKVGQVALSEAEQNEVVWQFIQDPDGELFRTRDWIEMIPASWDEIEGLERAAAWTPEHIEDRLRDYFAGRPNKWVELLKAKKP